MGEAFGQRSPVITYSSTLYLDCLLPAGSDLLLPNAYEELAAYVVSGEVVVDKDIYDAGAMFVVRPGSVASIQSVADARVMVIGGAKHGRRHIWWNFVSSSKARIEQAKQDWRDDRFPKVVDDDEYIPLPDG